MLRDDTIAAISTPPGRGGIGVIRLSGPRALEIAATLFRSPSSTLQAVPNRVQFGRIVDPNQNQTVDQALMTFFKGPHSYTGEDVVELSCHGAPVVLRRVLAETIQLGARIAEPGEFTFRAFLNRRIDLSQAQAVRDVIDAQTEYQAAVAIRQLAGSTSARLVPVKDALVEVIVHLESAVEFVEDDISPESSSHLRERLEHLSQSLRTMAAGFAFGRIVKEGFDLAIIGRPNVGKSSVFNRLAGADRAIVTALPGTTRDALYENASIHGIPVRLIDTAGIRETEDVVEKLGIARTRSAMADASILLLVLDGSEPLTEDDRRLLADDSGLQRIVVVNKIDLPRHPAAPELARFAPGDVLYISAETGAGLPELTDCLMERLGQDAAVERDDILITDARQYAALSRAVDALTAARDLLIQGELEEVVLLKLHGALQSLGEITGETLTEDILGQIFATFCIGK